MAGFRAQSYLIVLAWLVLIVVPQAILGQSELPAIVPAKPAADQLPPQRSFAPLPLNDLRSPSGAVGNVAESQPQPSVASTESALTPAVLPAQEGTTSGVFLRPQAAPPSPASDAPSFQAPAPINPPAPRMQEPGYQQSLNTPTELAPQPLRAAPAGSPSRPIELISDQPIQDNQIRLASGIESGSGITNQLPRGPAAGSLDVARQLLERYDPRRAPDPLPGRPMRLEDALQAASPERRRAIVRQYWQTYAAWASYLNRCDQCVDLARVVSGSDLQQSQLLETTRLLAEDERLQAELRLQWAQLELGRLLPSAGSELLPLPADQPLVQAYETHYDWYVANGALPPPVQAIARTLPKQLELLQRRALTAEAALSGLNRSGGQAANGATDLTVGLAKIDLAGQAQQAFLQAVLDYNQGIADYSLSITPAAQTPNAVAAMLVAPRAVNIENPPSVLAQGPRGTGNSRLNESTRVMTEPQRAFESQGFARPQQPIERVSGLEPSGAPGENAPPVVAPAFGGGPASLAPRPVGDSGASPITAPPAFSPPASAEKMQPPAGGTGATQNAGAVGGNFSPPGSFAPPPSIPSFDPPKPQSPGDQSPAPAPTGSSTGFKLGG